MAKRTSKKSNVPEQKKEEAAINTIAPGQGKKAEPKKSRAKKLSAPIASAPTSKVEKAAPKKDASVAVKKEKEKKPVTKKTVSAEGKKEGVNHPASRKATSVDANKPALRSVYSNSKYTLLVLGFGSDFTTKKSVVIFSDLLTAQVHTIALSLWNRWKLKEVKKINTET